MLNNYLSEIQKRFPNVPEGCVIAGGAIANTIFNIKYSWDAPIRDVDLYHFENKLRPSVGIVGNLTGEYNNLIIGGMTLIKVVEGGNYHHIFLNGAIPNQGLRIVDSFDLNCVQVAFDGEKLYCTSEFEEFLKTRILKVVHVHNTKTVFRLFKKQADLGCHFDKAHVLEIFSQLQLSNDGLIFNPFINDDYYKKIEKWIPELEKMGVYVVNNRISFPIPLLKLSKPISADQMITLVNWVIKLEKNIQNQIQDVICRFPNAAALIRTRPTEYSQGTSCEQWVALDEVYSNHPKAFFGYMFNGHDNYITIDDCLFITHKLHSLVKEYGDLAYSKFDSMNDVYRWAIDNALKEDFWIDLQAKIENTTNILNEE